MQSELIQLFIEKGSVLTVGMSYRIFLHNVDSLLFIEEGDFDIFALEPHQKEEMAQEIFLKNALKNRHTFLGDFIQGSLTYLFNLHSGRFIFPFALDASTSKYTVIALANTPVRLRILPLSEIYAYLQSTPPACSSQFIHCMEAWIHSFSPLFDNHPLPPATRSVQLNSRLLLQSDEIVAVPRHRCDQDKDAIPWIKVPSGSLHLFGIPSIRLSPESHPYPLTPLTWLKSDANTEIVLVETTPNLGAIEQLLQGLLHFHQTALDIVAYNNQQKLRLEQTSIFHREEREKELLNETLHTMDSLLTKKKVSILLPTNDPLLQACQLVGNRIHQTFIATAEGSATTSDDRLYEMCTTSNIYSRQIVLEKEWWKKDVGPLLGFIKGEEKIRRAVALLPSMPGHYELVDPAASKRQIIDADLAKQIDSKGTMFYRSLPDKTILESTDIIQFCLNGRGKDLVTIALVSLIGVILALFIPFSNKVLFDDVIPNLDAILLKQLLIGLGIIALSQLVVSLTKEYAILRIKSFLDHDLETALWGRLLNLPTHFFRRFTVGNLMQRISSIGQIRKIFSEQAIGILINALFSFVFLFAMLYYSPTLSLIGVSLLACSFIITTICFFMSQGLESKNQDLEGSINGKIIQIILGLSKIRTHGVENRIFAFWSQNNTESKKLSLRIGNIGNVANSMTNILYLLTTVAIFLSIMISMKQNAQGNNSFGLSIGTYLAFNSAFISFASAFLGFSHILNDMIFIYPMWQRCKVILQEPAEMGVNKLKPGKLNGEIRIDHVYFRYDNNSPLVHRDVSLYAAPGEFIAIVGPSGCGKSSLVRLLLGFETPQQGAIYFDGKDLAQLDLRFVRSQMGVILQNSTIMDGTIRENITGGYIASDEEVKQAVRLSGFEEDLNKMPMHLNTCLTNGGTTLSGGQRQRLLIARALLSKAKILIWDEATNALDNKTQALVTHNLEQLSITRIVIAHRLSTIRQADRIYVMDKGKVVERGTFTELANNKGLFADLLAHQTL